MVAIAIWSLYRSWTDRLGQMETTENVCATFGFSVHVSLIGVNGLVGQYIGNVNSIMVRNYVSIMDSIVIAAICPNRLMFNEHW